MFIRKLEVEMPKDACKEMETVIGSFCKTFLDDCTEVIEVSTIDYMIGIMLSKKCKKLTFSHLTDLKNFFNTDEINIKIAEIAIKDEETQYTYTENVFMIMIVNYDAITTYKNLMFHKTLSGKKK